MKIQEIREMTDDELVTKLKSLKEELFNLRFDHAVNKLENPSQITFVKKDIAKVKTVIREREIAATKNA